MNAKRPRPTGTTGKSDVAAEAWRLMAEFSFAEFKNPGQLEILREMCLTPGHLKALAVLDPDEPRPMRAMADALACDASMVTWLVDRLEERGLVERRTSPTDRRVKTLILTPLGIRTRVRQSNRLNTSSTTPSPQTTVFSLATISASASWVSSTTAWLVTSPRPTSSSSARSSSRCTAGVYQGAE